MLAADRSFAALALVTVSAILAVPAATAPAEAAPVVPCTRSFAGAAKAIAPETTPTTAPAYTWTTAPISVPASSQVEDIDVTFDITHAAAANMLVRLTRMVGSTATGSVELHQRFTTRPGAEPRPLTFDDEASAAFTATSPTGRYEPRVALSAFDGVAAGATWRLDIANWDAATTSRLNSWSVRISYAWCDADGDGAEDHTDNCRGLANPDQADLDADRVGDACDGDPDGDGIVGGADNCPRVASASLTDTDADGLGDPCDTDDDADGRADATDGCPVVAAGTTSGCPTATTRVTMDKKRGRLVGRVTSPSTACVASVELTLKKRKPGRDPRLVVVTSKPSGRFRTRVATTAGRYYVVLGKRYAVGVAECGSSRSATVRVRR